MRGFAPPTNDAMNETSRREAAPLEGGYTPTQRRIETAALVLFTGLALALVPRLAGAAGSLGAPAALAAAVLGVATADLLSGLGHWIGDTWGRTTWPLVGNGLIRGFREHHVDPEAITRHDFVETSGSLWVLLAPVMGLLLVVPVETGASRFTLLWAAAFSLALSVTNQIHKWAHQADPPRAARVMQRLRVILPPEHHAVHHRAPFDRHYCIATGWWNRPLAALGVFRGLERLVARLTGAVAREEERRLAMR